MTYQYVRIEYNKGNLTSPISQLSYLKTFFGPEHDPTSLCGIVSYYKKVSN